ncbi:MAG: iron chelate uptake ABC transporter family permease subunit [Cyanobacteria bacterium P01_A01_bin.80]
MGVVVPHLCRNLFKTVDHKILIPAVAIMGLILALVADLVSQLPGIETVLPLKSVTTLIGNPVLMWLIFHRRSRFFKPRKINTGSALN